jgi:hypothetical protein
VSKADESTKNRWLLPQAWGICLLLLVAGTYRLWLMPPGLPGLPAIPLVQFGIRLPGLASLIPSIVLIAGLLLVVVWPQRCHAAWWLVAGAFLVSFLVDQHRLQPWAYQGAIYALIWASMDRTAAQRWLIPLAASVYVYSAAGKFDFQFAHTVGQEFLSAFAYPIGGLPDSWDASLRTKLALILPATELLAGIGLLFRRTRTAAAVVVILIHVSLIAILGPWGLDHSTGVLIWNLSLIAQAYLLMIRPQRQKAGGGEEPAAASGPDRQLRRAGVAARFVQCLVVAALIAPLVERAGYWDHWPSWSLYSPHTSRVQIELHRSAIDRLDPALRVFAQGDVDQDGWHPLEIERWSLERRGVPIYPQARYQLALAMEIGLQHHLDDEIRVRVRSVSDRWTGRRQERRLLNLREIQADLNSYWLTLSSSH